MNVLAVDILRGGFGGRSKFGVEWGFVSLLWRVRSFGEWNFAI